MNWFRSPIGALRRESATVAQVLVAAAFVPSAPVLVPELAGPGASEIVPVRAAALAVSRELSARARRWMVVGLGDPDLSVARRGSFVGFGADVEVAIEPDATEPADPAMPLSVLIAGWLAGHCDPVPRLDVTLVDAGTSAAECRSWAADSAPGRRRSTNRSDSWSWQTAPPPWAPKLREDTPEGPATCKTGSMRLSVPATRRD